MKAIVKCIMMQKISRIGSYRDRDIIKNAIYLQVRLNQAAQELNLTTINIRFVQMGDTCLLKE